MINYTGFLQLVLCSDTNWLSWAYHYKNANLIDYQYWIQTIENAFDEMYKPNKSNQELIQAVLKKLSNKNRTRRKMPSSKQTLIEDNMLLSIKESVGDANNPI